MTEATKAAPKSGRGGRRPGAGRKKKSDKSASKLAGLDLKAALDAPVPEDVESVAQPRAMMAIGALVKQLQHGDSEPARIKASNAILDRAYGKPSVDAAGTQMTLFGAGVSVVAATQIRDEARKFATLAIATLEKIAANGASETARVQAATSLLDRGLGTVATATVPKGAAPKAMGKKEQAQVDAENAAAGRFATPAPPQMATETLQ